MIFCNDSFLSSAQAMQYSPLTLAYLGDAVYELSVREKLVRRENQPNGKLHREATAYVSASAQSSILEKLLPILSEDELAVFRRGRNSNATGGKNSDVMEYKRATGLECLFGYLYLTGNTARIQELFSLIFPEDVAD